MSGPTAFLLMFLAAPVFADESRVRIFANGSFAPGSLDFSEKRTFTEFVETGTIDARYSEKTGRGFEVGIQYRLSGHLGAALSLGRATRDGSATFQAALPHPLYLGQPRPASGELASLRYTETVGRLDLVWTRSAGPFDFLLFAGGSAFRVEADLLQSIQYTQSYPYDSVTVTGVPKFSVSDSPFGFDLGAGLDYRPSRRLGLGLEARFSRATAKLVPSPGNQIEVKAGGAQIAAGARLYF